jgi:hypothetical protein
VAIRPTIKVDGEHPSARAVAAPRGWHTRELLAELDYTTSEIETFLEEGSAHAHEA